MRLLLIAAMTGFGFLAACAPISRESCINDSAYDIGFAAAMENAEPDDRYQRISKICAKQSRTVDVVEYDRGFEVGTANFCSSPDNGYRWGRQGRNYNGVCASAEFSLAYENGLRLHKVEKREAEIKLRLDRIRDRLVSISDMLKNDKSLSEDKRRALAAEEDSLLLERSDLLAEQRSLATR